MTMKKLLSALVISVFVLGLLFTIKWIYKAVQKWNWCTKYDSYTYMKEAYCETKWVDSFGVTRQQQFCYPEQPAVHTYCSRKRFD